MSEDDARKCSGCGMALRKGALYCTECGQDVVRENRSDFVRFLVGTLASLAVSLLVIWLVLNGV